MSWQKRTEARLDCSRKKRGVQCRSPKARSLKVWLKARKECRLLS